MRFAAIVRSPWRSRPRVPGGSRPPRLRMPRALEIGPDQPLECPVRLYRKEISFASRLPVDWSSWGDFSRTLLTHMELSIPAFWQEIAFRDDLILSVAQFDGPPPGWEEATPIT